MSMTTREGNGNEFQFACLLCGQRFLRSAELEKHTKQLHQAETPCKSKKRRKSTDHNQSGHEGPFNANQVLG